MLHNMANWTIGNTIGRPGGFGQVYHVTSDTGQKAALKNLLRPNTVNKQRFEREINILHNSRSPIKNSIFQRVRMSPRMRHTELSFRSKIRYINL